jgi:preprotein translocase subunit SecA
LKLKSRSKMSKLDKIFSRRSDNKKLKEAEKIVDKVASFEEEFKSLAVEEFPKKTQELKDRAKKAQKIDDVMPEAFALFREASHRVLGLRPYDVQLIGAYIMNRGDIAEMKTGEGKSLTAAMAAYSRSISGEPVHVITVNEYLAIRDAEYFEELFTKLGVSVSFNISALTKTQKTQAYEADITYSTNSEIGFDYLRDNMVSTKESRVQRGLKFAIIDEADSILIDEGRTPLIISGNAKNNTNGVKKADAFVKSLSESDVTIDPAQRSVNLNDSGVKKAETYYTVEHFYQEDNVDNIQLINKALYANFMMDKDKEYVVRGGAIEIVDQSTGRILDGRSFSDGLHQAIEAKENVAITDENTTIATITYQNLFRLYERLSGMTGTAKTEEEEFLENFNMHVIPVPTNRPMIRVDEEDEIYASKKDKHDSVINEVKKAAEKEQPVLLGTGSVEESEEISKLLKKENIQHSVLNAKNHANEARIIENAGQKNAITVATNMAGRGTDIKLGEGVAELGGLYVIGTDRHESRRIDNQLRGRSGRQGDKGRSKFMISLDDDIFKRYASPRPLSILKAAMKGSADPIKQKRLSKMVADSQLRAEGNNFDARKELLKYDGILKEQREIVYSIRNAVLDDKDIESFIDDAIINAAAVTISKAQVEDVGRKKVKIDSEKLNELVEKSFGLKADFSNNEIVAKEAVETLSAKIREKYDNLSKKYGSEYNVVKKVHILDELDDAWQEHIDFMSNLRESVSLLGYAQEDPLVVYQERGFSAFKQMMERVYEHVIIKVIGTGN